MPGRYTIGPAFGLTVTVAAVGISVTWASWLWTVGIPANFPGQFPMNCHTVVIYNSDAANTLLVGDNVLELGGPVTQGFRIPPLGTMTIAIGSSSNRIGGTGDGFVFDAIGGAVIADVTFICGLES